MRRNLRLLRLGIAGELRNPAFRLMGLLGALAAGAYAWQQGALAGSTAVALTAWAGRGFALACCLWFGSGALRDQDARLGAVLRSKPIDGARWSLLVWATGIGLWLVLLACVFLGAMLGQWPASGVHSVTAHGLGFIRAVLIMVPLSTLGFALSRIGRSPLGAAVVVLGFVCALAGLQFMPAFLRPDYTQNLGLYVAAGLTALVVTSGFVERVRRGELRRPAVPMLILLGSFGLTAAGAQQAYRAAAPPAAGTVAEMMDHQFLQEGHAVPGFWLPDQRGRRVSLTDYPGSVFLIYLFSPDDADAARSLPAMEEVRRRYRGRHVQPIAVCLSPDQGEGAALGWGAGLGFPIVSDRTTVKSTSPPESSIAGAYHAEVLPLLVVTDRRRRVRALIKEPSYSRERLQALVEERLTEEPE